MMKYLILALFFVFADASMIIEIKDKNGSVTKITKDNEIKSEILEKQLSEVVERNLELERENQELIRENRELTHRIQELRSQNQSLKSLVKTEEIKIVKSNEQKEKETRIASGEMAKIATIAGIALAVLIFGAFIARLFRAKSRHQLAE